jgi:hypothetical protein
MKITRIQRSRGCREFQLKCQEIYHEEHEEREGGRRSGSTLYSFVLFVVK